MGKGTEYLDEPAAPASVRSLYDYERYSKLAGDFEDRLARVRPSVIAPPGAGPAGSSVGTAS